LVKQLSTTDNLEPVISEITLHEEVPEGRVIQGHDMTFHAPVYGELVSSGGKVGFENTLGWGSVVNPMGRVHGKKRVFHATLQAPGGVIELASAESCLIIGREVTLREAVKCQIFAHTLHIGTAAGCLIAGRNVHIRHAKDHKSESNVITMVVPDMPDLNAVLAPQNAEIADLSARVAALTQQIDALKADPALTQYLSIRAKVRVGMLELSGDKAQGYQQMSERLEGTAKALESAVAARRPLAEALESVTRQVQEMRQEQAARLADCRCKIESVGGETIVRQLLEAHDDPDLSLIPLPMIPKILFRNDASLKFLYAVHQGKVDWSVA
jgi:hypothetical protein